MTQAIMEEIAKNSDKKWFLNQKEVAQLTGYRRQQAAAFLTRHSVRYFRIGKEKKYFLRDVMEAIEKTQWSD